jgi:hypothetical protein
MKNNYSNLQNTYKNLNLNVAPDDDQYGFWPGPSLSGHDCKKQTDNNCNNPGRGVCYKDYSKVCGQAEQLAKKCFASQTDCQLYNTCDEEGGWTLNKDGTDCDSYKCTTTGDFPSDKSTNNDQRYFYAPPPLPLGQGQIITGSCYRKAPDPLTHESQYEQCAKTVFGGCNNSPSTAGIGYMNEWKTQGWTVTGCDYDTGCYLNVQTDSNVNTVGNNQITYYNIHHSEDQDPFGNITYKLSYVPYSTSSIVNLAPGEMS